MDFIANGYGFEQYIANELSMVSEVESVFVECDGDPGKGYSVITVINERDPNIREKIYAREQVIMDEFPKIDFSFSVISRMNRPLADIITPVGNPAFQR